MTNFEYMAIIATVLAAMYAAFCLGGLVVWNNAVDEQLARYDALNAELTAEISALEQIMKK